MGYSIFANADAIFIPQANIDEGLRSVQKLIRLKSELRRDRGFAFVDQDAAERATSLEIMLAAWRWIPDIDASGNITSLEFVGEKLGDDELLFDTLSPFIKSGSFLDIVGEDCKTWRWLFRDGVMKRLEGTILYTGEDL